MAIAGSSLRTGNQELRTDFVAQAALYPLRLNVSLNW